MAKRKKEEDSLFNGGLDNGLFDNMQIPANIMLSALCSMNKPLGMTWSDDKIEKFLKARGYIIIERCSEDNPGTTYHVAVKPEEACIPELDYGNIVDVFEDELQEVLINWLIKIGTEK